jgi:hypothetical protein
MNDVNVKAIEIFVSDPWEFGTEHGVGPFRCMMSVSLRNDAWQKVLLSKPIEIEGKSCDAVWIKARHVSNSLADVFSGGEIAANFVFSSSDSERDGGEGTGFPGPFAAIGSIRLSRSSGRM